MKVGKTLYTPALLARRSDFRTATSSGRSTADPGRFFQLYRGLRDKRNITIDLMRGGKRQTLNYEIR